MENFTPIPALAGGVLIGLAATVLLWLNGRLAGVSGILNTAMDPRETDRAWRLLFLAGLMIGAGVYVRLVPEASPPHIGPSVWTLIAAGLLVGFGTRMGAGCTSGHGVCGIARLSIRSIVATLVFMIAGMATVFVVRHVAGH